MFVEFARNNARGAALAATRPTPKMQKCRFYEARRRALTGATNIPLLTELGRNRVAPRGAPGS